VGFVDTRDALHAIAEQVLAPARYERTQRIGLRVTPKGFGTPPFAGLDGERQLSVRDASLVDRVDGNERTIAITTVRAAAEFVGVSPGVPDQVYEQVTHPDLDAPLDIDVRAAREIAAWFALADEALRQLVAITASTDAEELQLWPEHFDLATSIGRVNYGASPGDAAHDDPYLYVGPWDARSGAFWNEPFGASVPASRVADVAAAVNFFVEGFDLIR
jgi:hypothetical protein